MSAAPVRDIISSAGLTGQHTFVVDFPGFGLFRQVPGNFFFRPSVNDKGRSRFGISQQCLGHCFVSRGILVLELAHGAVIRFDSHAFHAFDIRRGRALVNDELAGSLDIGRTSLVEEVDVIPGYDICEKAVDILKGLIIRVERLDELGRAFDDLLGQDRTADILQERTPFGHVGAIVGSSQEEKTIRGHEDGTEMLDLLTCDTATVDQRALDHEAPE